MRERRPEKRGADRRRRRRVECEWLGTAGGLAIYWNLRGFSIEISSATSLKDKDQSIDRFLIRYERFGHASGNPGVDENKLTKGPTAE